MKNLNHTNAPRFRVLFATLLFACTVGAKAAVVQNEVAELLASDGLNDQLGFATAVDGDTALIGAYRKDGGAGSAYVFTRDGSGMWTEQAKLVASDRAGGDQFGYSVAVSGGTAVIGARLDDDKGLSSGSAYVFTRDGLGNWSQNTKLLASDGAAGEQFGQSVALDGGTAVIGAYRDNGNAGSAFVFTDDGLGWSEHTKLTASDAGSGDLFGESVAIDGDTILIGARLGDDPPTTVNFGAAYVFTRDNSGDWDQEDKLLPMDSSFSFFGWSVDINGDTAVVGAVLKADNGTNSGSAYIFYRDAGVWNQQAKLLPSDGAEQDWFGNSVAVDGDVAIISAYQDDDNDTNSGSAYVFSRDGSGTWTEQVKLLASDGEGFDWFGYYIGSVSIAGGTLIVGAPRHRHDAPSTPNNVGAAYIFAFSLDEEGPITSNVIATPNPVPINSATTLTATVDDTATGGSDIASADYTIDGGSGVGMTAQAGGFDQMTEDVTAVVPAFAEAGVHYLCVSGADTAGNTGEENCTFLAVYDPSAGFVTGGGWITSPVGACQFGACTETTTGKANFGFVSKYKKGANTPSGETEFQFKAGGLNFHSASYEYLVIIVAGAKAIFKGVGTINGEGDYGFMITALDEKLSQPHDKDLFRIKIWDRSNNDAVVYDNQLGGADGDDPTTAIGGGSIVIHKAK